MVVAQWTKWLLCIVFRMSSFVNCDVTGAKSTDVYLKQWNLYIGTQKFLEAEILHRQGNVMWKEVLRKISRAARMAMYLADEIASGRTAYLWCQKWPLCQLSHNHCPKLCFPYSSVFLIKCFYITRAASSKNFWTYHFDVNERSFLYFETPVRPDLLKFRHFGSIKRLLTILMLNFVFGKI